MDARLAAAPFILSIMAKTAGRSLVNGHFKSGPNDTIDSIREKGLKLEWELYSECIQLFAAGRIKTVKTDFALRGGEKVSRTVVKIV
jgi:hypothetical protein